MLVKVFSPSVYKILISKASVKVVYSTGFDISASQRPQLFAGQLSAEVYAQIQLPYMMNPWPEAEKVHLGENITSCSELHFLISCKTALLDTSPFLSCLHENWTKTYNGNQYRDEPNNSVLKEILL